nr:RNA-directed DNA polymerase, eukaryota, reverse transcriptase zinc-binding domain protein [Tanacetum cinerariifolium]
MKTNTLSMCGEGSIYNPRESSRRMGLGRQILDCPLVVNEWVKWIQTCLISARASALVNGSLTNEFSLQRGLRQGDPLSPFLFILAMEELRAAIEDAVALDFFKDLRVGDGDARISLLFYADDAMFKGKWDDTNITNIIIILNCFYLVTGLRLNLDKSKLYGVRVALDDVEPCSGATGCSVASLPFNYLGLPIRSNMNIKSNWVELILKVQKKLAN